MSKLTDNYWRVRERIAQAARRAGRTDSDVTLVAISKGHPLSMIAALMQVGQRDFGENRVPEGSEKVVASRTTFDPAAALRWHFVGNIQRRKAREVVEHFGLLHAVDRPELGERLSKLAVERATTVRILLECNTSGEASKAGFATQHWAEDAAQRTAFFTQVTHLLTLPGLIIDGLMTMAPIVDDPEATRPVFRRLAGLRTALAQQFPQAPWSHLSMGMTDDFEVAVEEGATLVRVGRAIFETTT